MSPPGFLQDVGPQVLFPHGTARCCPEGLLGVAVSVLPTLAEGTGSSSLGAHEPKQLADAGGAELVVVPTWRAGLFSSALTHSARLGVLWSLGFVLFIVRPLKSEELRVSSDIIATFYPDL